MEMIRTTITTGDDEQSAGEQLFYLGDLDLLATERSERNIWKEL
jgi:hypothetical protein